MTRAEALALTAYVFSREADEYLYQLPRTDEADAEGERLKAEADRAYEAAIAIDPEDHGLWRRAVCYVTGETP